MSYKKNYNQLKEKVKDLMISFIKVTMTFIASLQLNFQEQLFKQALIQ